MFLVSHILNKTNTAYQKKKPTGGRIKENDGGGEFTMIYYKNFCKCHIVPPAQ
jgi:hypothetical protein